MSRLAAIFFVNLQKVLPKYLLTTIVRKIAGIRIVPLKNFLIRRFVAAYKVDMDDIEHSVPDDFDTFNAFFTRELKVSARPIDADMTALVSPVDGTVSAAGRIEDQRIFQAKGFDYSLLDLLATDTDSAMTYSGGDFATIYLAPYNYHRVHAPLPGKLESICYVPGNLYSVNRATVTHLNELFVRNERLICHLNTASGPMVMIFVGAMNVGSISTRWTGEIRPRKSGVVEQFDTAQFASGTSFEKGELLGWFNMGSTIILLSQPGAVTEFDQLSAGQEILMGRRIGRVENLK